MKVEFWKAIYTKYTTRQGIVHDSEDLSIIYDAIQLPENGSTAGLNALKNRIRETLHNIVLKKGRDLNPEERRVLAKFPRRTSKERLMRATQNVRFQLGQSDRFREGVIRSGRYIDYIEEVLRKRGMPDYLKYLPHVESSFQESAMSKFGAAGIWQLMPATGRDFLQVNYSIDERFDPWFATIAAVKHLERDYKYLKSWPLAITAYNHGAGGIRKAMKFTGSDRIQDIVFKYSSRRFGFASRNFYAQFVAAVQVASNYRQYFGKLNLHKAYKFESKRLKTPTYFKVIQREHKVTKSEFKKLNPGLRSPVLKNRRPIPRFAVVRLPLGSRRPKVLVAALEHSAVSAIEKEEKIPELKVSTPIKEVEVKKVELKVQNARYKVRDYKKGKGTVVVAMNETLTLIADWLGVPVSAVAEWNGMKLDSKAGLGQKILVQMNEPKLQSFEQMREDYHASIREEFFARYNVSDLVDYKVRKGDSLWSLCYQKFDVPPWLLAEYNPLVSFASLTAGVSLKIPVVHKADEKLLAVEN
jgi:membrane-bound lytic murein transglycosylase D